MDRFLGESRQRYKGKTLALRIYFADMSAPPQVSLIIDDSVNTHFRFPAGTVTPSSVPLSVFYDSSAEMPGPSIEGKAGTFVNILFDGEIQLTSVRSIVCEYTIT